MSVSVDLANAIVARLNAPTYGFTVAFEAQRLTVPLAQKELENLSDISVQVFSGAKSASERTRGRFIRTYKPFVVVMKRLEGLDAESELAEVDSLLQLVEDIEAAVEDYNPELESGRLGFIGFDEDQDRELYNAEAMDALKVFAAAITLQYMG